MTDETSEEVQTQETDPQEGTPEPDPGSKAVRSRTRTRTRTRQTARSGSSGEQSPDEGGDTPGPDTGGDADTPASPDGEVAADSAGDRGTRRRRRRRSSAQPGSSADASPPADTPPAGAEVVDSVPADTAPTAEAAGAAVGDAAASEGGGTPTDADATPGSPTGADASGGTPTDADASAGSPTGADASGGTPTDADARAAESGDGAKTSGPDAEDEDGRSTRRKSSRRGREKTDRPADVREEERGRRSGGNRPRGQQRAPRGRRPSAGLSDETRRAVAEGPPRRMLVTVAGDRTQAAVLEDRDLVEHYVARTEDVSYVGNIYMGRIQNVLPGMEAAFVDIGKGRNGVLYAGEVDYEETDLEGESPRIEQTLKAGQSVLVQVTKDPMGTKGARLTQQLSIAGRYCVLAPGDGMLGISRKLADDERDRLRQILKDIKPDGFGLIVRTAAEGATREQLEGDVARLERIWAQVDRRAKEAKALEPVYEEPGLVIRVIRDTFGPEYTDLIIDDEHVAEKVREYLADVSPELTDRVSVYTGEDHLFDAYEVTTQIRRALEKKVWLPSGGYLIIEKTEAMWVIDVNTGKFVGQDNLEETVLRNNLEAAGEIARQLRLRDMGGIIVIDFVDMLVPANRDEVLKRFRRELARDKTKSRVMEISKLGLVQMTRKNVSQGVAESFTTVCDCCEGRGAQIVERIV